jgi:hypothetical protein
MPITEGGRFTPNDNIVSPGVFTREIDQSSVAQGVADIGAVVVAPFAKGPGFSPTVCNSVTELEQRFGVSDGTLYGPYTAKQYLQEKGFVTVCRVGALTGYHQKYPWVMWAESGEWLRAADAAWLNPTASWADITNLDFSGSYANIDNASGSLGANVSGSVLFNSTPVTITLMAGACKADLSNLGNISGSVPRSGSVLYHEQTITGYISGVFTFSSSLSSSLGLVTTASAMTASNVINGLFAANAFVGPMILSRVTRSVGSDTTTFYTEQAPFDMFADFYGGVPVMVSQSINSCNQPSLNIFAFLTGTLGPFNGAFRPGSNLSYNSCTNQWEGSGSAYKVLAVLADTQFGGIQGIEAPGFSGSTQSYNPAITGESIVHEFDLALSQSGDGAYGKYHFSLDASNIQYITNVFGTKANVGDPDPDLYAAGTKKEAAYLYKIFEDDIAAIQADPSHWRVNGDAMPSASWVGEPTNFTDRWSENLLNGDSEFGLTNASTPWVVSQQISPWNGGTATRFPLFKIWTMADGTYTNTSFKIEISNVKLAGTVAGGDWGTFTLTVRDYSDTDKKPKILEQFNNLTLDPSSANFIARRIGDRYNYIRFDGKIIEFGTYANLSKNIRIEMSTNPYPVTAVPYGFQAYAAPVNGSIGQWCNPVAYTKASVYGLFPGKYPSGVDFGGVPSGADSELAGLYPTSSAGTEHWRDNLQYNAPLPAGASVGSNELFALDNYITDNGVGSGSYAALAGTNAIPATYDAANETTYVKMRKFVFGFQGGFDGQSPAIPLNLGADITAGNTQGLDCTNSTTAGSIAYNQCIGALGNADEFDINLIATPGIIYSLHSYVTNLVVEMCETRGDCFYILDLYQDDGNPTSGQIDEVVNLAKEFDTSYACAYYPWIKIKDTNINQIVTVPPSVVMPSVYAANDRVAGEWWAAAGLNRGGITQAVQVTDRTTHTERDALYEGRVNPIAAFPGQGIVAWGQKTLQVDSSALDRINVRRLLIEIKKFFASTARYLVFEQNTAATRNKFLAIANPYLESIQQRSGLYAFQIVMDASNNTPDLIDRNILYGQIYLKPTKTAEFIVMDFNIMSTGASFPTA